MHKSFAGKGGRFVQAEGTQNVNILDERDWLIYGWSVLNEQVSGVK